jgi:hypothetical protein
MKLEDFSDVYFVISVLVPGFIYSGVVSAFVPLRAHSEKNTLLLRYLTATAFNYAICSPLIYLLVIGHILAAHPVGQAICWFFIMFIAPVLLAMARAKIIQSDGLGWLYRWLGLRVISPIPTGWDWIFNTTGPCFILVTLTDGTEIAGYFGKRSMASSDPDRKDIYIETVYTVPEDEGPWALVQGSLGMHIDGSQITYIEFRKVDNDG